MATVAPPKAKHHRKRHVMAGPAGLWFQQQASSSNRNVPPNAAVDDANQHNNTTNSSHNPTFVNNATVWNSMQQDLSLPSVHLPPHASPSERYRLLRPHWPSDYLLLPDLHLGQADWILTKKLCVWVHSIRSHQQAWTVVVTDLTHETLTCWVEPAWVQQELKAPSQLVTGAGWLLTGATVVLSNKLTRLLLVAPQHLRQTWRPTAPMNSPAPSSCLSQQTMSAPLTEQLPPPVASMRLSQTTNFMVSPPPTRTAVSPRDFAPLGVVQPVNVAQPACTAPVAAPVRNTRPVDLSQFAASPLPTTKAPPLGDKNPSTTLNMSENQTALANKPFTLPPASSSHKRRTTSKKRAKKPSIFDDCAALVELLEDEVWLVEDVGVLWNDKKNDISKAGEERTTDKTNHSHEPTGLFTSDYEWSEMNLVDLEEEFENAVIDNKQPNVASNFFGDSDDESSTSA